MHNEFTVTTQTMCQKFVLYVNITMLLSTEHFHFLAPPFLSVFLSIYILPSFLPCFLPFYLLSVNGLMQFFPYVAECSLPNKFQEEQ